MLEKKIQWQSVTNGLRKEHVLCSPFLFLDKVLHFFFFMGHYYFRFDRGVVCIVVAVFIVDHYSLRFDREVVCIVVAGYVVDHYCLMFDRGVVHIVVAFYIVSHYC